MKSPLSSVAQMAAILPVESTADTFANSTALPPSLSRTLPTTVVTAAYISDENTKHNMRINNLCIFMFKEDQNFLPSKSNQKMLL